MKERLLRLCVAVPFVLMPALSADAGEASALEGSTGITAAAADSGRDNGAGVAFESAARQRYANMRTFQSEVECRIVIMEATNVLTGRMSVETPGKWRISLESRTEGGRSRLMVFDLCDGQNRWVYDAASQSIMKRSVPKDAGTRTRFFPAFEACDANSVRLLKRDGDTVRLRLNTLAAENLKHCMVLDVNTATSLISRMEFLGFKGRSSMVVSFIRPQADIPVGADEFEPVNLPELPVVEVKDVGANPKGKNK
jgi:outer membrane lipoprotein-sorting protein